MTLQGVDSDALQILVDYVYTSEVEVTEDNVQSLLPAANLLQLTDVRYLEILKHTLNLKT